MMDCVSEVIVVSENFTWSPINIFFFVFVASVKFELFILFSVDLAVCFFSLCGSATP